jgi:SpoVK/Ycf46/Vps4 family AAA+-type ATPase
MRRFDKRVYIGLPEEGGRTQALLMHTIGSGVRVEEGVDEAAIERLVASGACEGMSYADIARAAQDAMMAPVRECMKATHFKRTGNKIQVPTDAAQATVRAVGSGAEKPAQKPAQTPAARTVQGVRPCAWHEWGAFKATLWEIEPHSLEPPPTTLAHLKESIEQVQ